MLDGRMYKKAWRANESTVRVILVCGIITGLGALGLILPTASPGSSYSDVDLVIALALASAGFAWTTRSRSGDLPPAWPKGFGL